MPGVFQLAPSFFVLCSPGDIKKFSVKEILRQYILVLPQSICPEIRKLRFYSPLCASYIVKNRIAQGLPLYYAIVLAPHNSDLSSPLIISHCSFRFLFVVSFFDMFLHMIPGSITVQEGDTVKEGDVIGLLGNSGGQSDIPHLHFEVVTGKPAIIGGEGYPFVFRSFDLIAGLNQSLLDERTSSPGYTSEQYWQEFGDFVTFFSQPIPQQNKLQENWAIVRFP